MLERTWNAQDRQVRTGNPGAWDGGVLMDPGVGSYSNEMSAQAARRVAMMPHFQGVVVDRSDYARFYNLDRDDGVTCAMDGANASKAHR